VKPAGAEESESESAESDMDMDADEESVDEDGDNSRVTALVPRTAPSVQTTSSLDPEQLRKQRQDKVYEFEAELRVRARKHVDSS